MEKSKRNNFNARAEKDVCLVNKIEAQIHLDAIEKMEEITKQNKLKAKTMKAIDDIVESRGERFKFPLKHFCQVFLVSRLEHARVDNF